MMDPNRVAEELLLTCFNSIVPAGLSHEIVYLLSLYLNLNFMKTNLNSLLVLKGVQLLMMRAIIIAEGPYRLWRALHQLKKRSCFCVGMFNSTKFNHFDYSFLILYLFSLSI